MTLRHKERSPQFTYYYLWLIAGITISIGIVLVVMPSMIGHLFFNNSDSSMNFFVRMLGSTLIGYGILCWLAAKSGNINVYKVAVWSNLSTLLIATVISLSYSSIYSSYGWLVIGQHLIFVSGFLYSAYDLSNFNNTDAT